MFEIAFKVNPDSEFYKNYFMKKAEKEKFLELADEFVEKYFLGEWLSLALSDRLTIRLNAEGTRKYAPQTTKHSNRPGFSTFKKQSSIGCKEKIEMNNNYCPIPGASQPKEQPKTIVERIGEPAFLEQLAEECSELAQAAVKTQRLKPLTNAMMLCRKKLQT